MSLVLGGYIRQDQIQGIKKWGETASKSALREGILHTKELKDQLD